MALLVGAMMIHGIVPGPRVIEAQPDLFWGIVASMWIGNAMLLVLNLPLVGIWVSLLAVPYRLLFPSILVICSIGAYSLSNSPFDIWVMVASGALGYLLAKLQCEPAPLLLGFVLGPFLEENLRRSMLLSHGDPSIFVQRPVSLFFVVCTLALLLLMVIPSFRRTREVAFKE
jgi:putative tricarboxylic transport membrane protein